MSESENYKKSLKKHHGNEHNPTNPEEAVSCMRKIVHALAYKWTRNHRQDYDDIFGEGMVGVCVAWKRYHKTKYEKEGYRFSTYAYLWASAQMKSFTEANWKYKNNTCEEDNDRISPIHNAETQIDEGAIDLHNTLYKFDKKDRELFILRQYGYTFAEIADRLDLKSLHIARKRYLIIEEKLNADLR